MKAGDVFRFTGIADIHLWMIISDPSKDAAKVLIVNFTTWEPHLDQACEGHFADAIIGFILMQPLRIMRCS